MPSLLGAMDTVLSCQRAGGYAVVAYGLRSVVIAGRMAKVGVALGERLGLFGYDSLGAITTASHYLLDAAAGVLTALAAAAGWWETPPEEWIDMTSRTKQTGPSRTVRWRSYVACRCHGGGRSAAPLRCVGERLALLAGGLAIVGVAGSPMAGHNVGSPSRRQPTR